MRNVLREDSTSMLWRVGQVVNPIHDESHVLYFLFLFLIIAVHTLAFCYSPILSALQTLETSGSGLKTLFWSLTDSKFLGMDPATWLVTSSSLPLRTVRVAFSFGPFPPFVFPSCGLNVNEANRRAGLWPPSLRASPAAVSMSPNAGSSGCCLLTPWLCTMGVEVQASPGIAQQNVEWHEMGSWGPHHRQIWSIS